jgi:hypothetical protein
MAVADFLKKFPHEVEEISCEEFDNILLYMQYKGEEEEKAMQKAQKKARAKKR